MDPSPQETTLTKDGVEVVVKSVDCQTEWSWLKDMEMVQRLSATPGGKFSHASTTRPTTSKFRCRCRMKESNPCLKLYTDI